MQQTNTEHEDFKPYISAEKNLPELTLSVIIIGGLLSVVFGAANAYLGLRAGMTVSASIPAAVISMCLFRIVLRRSAILENNMAQTIGSAGESIAAGVIFTIPAFYMWASEWGTEPPSLIEITTIAFAGGLLGLFFMAPLRNALIVKEHKTLLYPEGRACANILLAGEMGGQKAAKIFRGLGFAAVYSFLSNSLQLFKGEVEYALPFLKGAGIGCITMPAMLGVGFIVGKKVGGTLVAGGLLSWCVLMPLLSFFGGQNLIYPGTVPISEMDMWGLWGKYIRYIGAGALSASGIICLIKIVPLLCRSLKETLSNLSQGTGKERTAEELSLKVVIPGILVVLLLLLGLPFMQLDLLGVVLLGVFGFIFAAVSARVTGVVGSSNNPASGMTIATLLFVTLIYLVTGHNGHSGMLMVLTVGAVVCTVSCLCGDVTQDLKTGFLLGATPVKQQLGELIGVAASSLAIGAVVTLLNTAWGFGSKELAAPQAMIMKTLIEGIMAQDLPWTLFLVGVGCALMAELLGVTGLAFAIGMYLPVSTSVPILLGGLVRAFWEKRAQDAGVQDLENEEHIVNGTLAASGFIAAEGLVGVATALLTVLNINLSLEGSFGLGYLGSMGCYLVLIGFFIWLTKK